MDGAPIDVTPDIYDAGYPLLSVGHEPARCEKLDGWPAEDEIPEMLRPFVFDTCKAERSESYANVCKQQVINKAIQLEQTDEIQNQVSQALGEINSLSNRVALAKDSKESQDLANSIQLKSVMLNTLTTQWEMSVKAADKREKVLEAERVKQWNQQQLNAPTADLNNL